MKAVFTAFLLDINTTMFWIILVLCLIGCFILFKVRKKFKTLNIDAITLINGGVKCGKTTLAVHLAIKNYKKNLLRYKVRSFFQKLFHFLFKKYNVVIDEKPLLYSNIPLKVPYVPITKDILLRKQRMNFKSVVLLSESSLIIDSMTYKDALINEQTTLFFKLFGHETHGGKMFVETQNINDNHFSVKRALNRYVWIYSLIKCIPFVLVFKTREMVYAEGEGAHLTNVFNSDVDDTIKYVVCSKKIWKKFDCYCYSKMTDDLLSNTDVVDYCYDLKIDDFVSFKKWLSINKEKGVQHETK